MEHGVQSVTTGLITILPRLFVNISGIQGKIMPFFSLSVVFFFQRKNQVKLL